MLTSLTRSLLAVLVCSFSVSLGCGDDGGDDPTTTGGGTAGTDGSTSASGTDGATSGSTGSNTTGGGGSGGATTTGDGTGTAGGSTSGGGLPGPGQTYGECVDECINAGDQCVGLGETVFCRPECTTDDDCPQLDGLGPAVCRGPGDEPSYCFLTCSAEGADEECPAPGTCQAFMPWGMDLIACG